MSGRLRFDGWIAGLGTASGTRVVLGHWPRSPFGPFSDVMLERPDGERLLLAPTRQTADFVSGTYVFDTVRVVPVDVRVVDGTWSITAGPLDLRFTTGRRRLLGLVLCAVPGVLARQPAWCTLISFPPACCCPVSAPVAVRVRGAGSGTEPGTCGRSTRCRGSSRATTSVRRHPSSRPCASGSGPCRGPLPHPRHDHGGTRPE